MVIHRANNMRTARIRAMEARKQGFRSTIFRIKEGKLRVSVTRK